MTRVRLPVDDQECELLPTAESYPRPAAPQKQQRRWLITMLVLVALITFFEGVRIMADRELLAQQTERLAHSILPASFFPTGHSAIWDNRYLDENNEAIRALMQCMMDDNCQENQKDVIMLSAGKFAGSEIGFAAGEHIWSGSILASLREMNYTVLMSKPIQSDEDAAFELAQQYHQFPDLVKLIIAESTVIKYCVEHSHCIKSAEQTLGVPAWKLFSFDFFASDPHPLGNAWNLNAVDYSNHSWAAGNTYIGYTVARTCTAHRFVPPAARPHRAYVFGKNLEYFTRVRFPWTGVDFRATPLAGVAGAVNGSEPVPEDGLPWGIRNLGRLGPDAFVEEVGRSKVLVGLGDPIDSPTPYDALCMGVPFINPVLGWDHDEPDNREKWGVQHYGLKWTDEPWVYHVRTGDLEGLADALRRAADNPIERYIAPEMTIDAVKGRLTGLIHTDWRSRAEAVLDERKQSGEGQLFIL